MKFHYRNSSSVPACDFNLKFPVNAVNVLDGILQEFSSGIDVDLMPGENDPANQIMPQQPLHCCLFPKAGKFKTLKMVPNPYMFEVCGVTFLGTSGQNLEDVMKNSNISDPIEALECLVRWSHLAPTCPDTLGNDFVFLLNARSQTSHYG